jgi:hypothetical protein
MSSEIAVVEGLDQERWDAFVAGSANGTIFHTARFLGYHPPGRFPFRNLAFLAGDEPVAVLPGALREDGAYVSPAGASYGSFAFAEPAYGTVEAVVDALLAWAREAGVRELRLTPPPAIYARQLNEVDKYALEYRGFTPSQNLISNVTPVTPEETDDDLLARLSGMHRRAVRKSLREGVTVGWSDDLAGYHAILVENKRKFGLPPTHSLEELATLVELFPDGIRVLAAWEPEGAMIAGICLFSCNPQVLLAFYIASLAEYQELRPVNRLLWESMRIARDEGFRWLDLGVSQDTSSDNPMEPARSLISFKEGSADSLGVLRTTYRLELLP